jgi:hypothetical protein
MPNIFKRPMFRKGGSSSYGTGITSGLEPRQKFEEGATEEGVQSIPRTSNISNMNPLAYEELIKRQYEQMLPSNEQAIRNLITGFGSSAPADPMQLQTFGTAFSRAGTVGSGLNREQIAKAEDFRTRAGIEAVKNLTKANEAKVTAAITNAKEYARVNYENYSGATAQEKMQNAYKDKFAQLLSKERAVTSQIELIRQKEKEITNPNAAQQVKSNARKAAETAVKIDEGDITVPGGYSGYISITSRGLSDIIPQGDGTTAIINKDKPGLTSNIPYIPNKNYIDPDTGSVYQYQGQGTFKRVYP